MTPKYLTIKELCDRYGVSRQTIFRWERAGHIPRADRSRGRPRWWLPQVEDNDHRRVEQAQKMDIRPR